MGTIFSKHKQLYSLVFNLRTAFYFLFFWLLSGLRESSLTLVFLLSGSLDSEAGIYALCYDLTGSRLISCEADKTIKMWKEDENATPETHPLSYKPPKDIRRF